MGNKWSSKLFIRNAFRCSQNFTALAVKGFKENIQKDCKSKKKLQLINNKLDCLMWESLIMLESFPVYL